jgi:hypothetical protein
MVACTKDKSWPVPLPTGLGGEEGLEDPRTDGFGNTHAGIGDADLGRVRQTAGGNGDFSFAAGGLVDYTRDRLCRIDDEVQDRLVKLSMQAGNQRQGVVEM